MGVPAHKDVPAAIGGGDIFEWKAAKTIWVAKKVLDG